MFPLLDYFHIRSPETPDFLLFFVLISFNMLVLGFTTSLGILSYPMFKTKQELQSRMEKLGRYNALWLRRKRGPR